MQPPVVVKLVNVTIQSIPQLAQAVKYVSSYQFRLERMEKRLHMGIVGTVAGAVDASFDSSLIQFISETVSCVFYAPVCVKDHPRLGAAFFEGVVER